MIEWLSALVGAIVKAVLSALLGKPYGETKTYGDSTNEKNNHANPDDVFAPDDW